MWTRLLFFGLILTVPLTSSADSCSSLETTLFPTAPSTPVLPPTLDFVVPESPTFALGAELHGDMPFLLTLVASSNPLRLCRCLVSPTPPNGIYLVLSCQVIDSKGSSGTSPRRR